MLYNKGVNKQFYKLKTNLFTKSSPLYILFVFHQVFLLLLDDHRRMLRTYPTDPTHQTYAVGQHVSAHSEYCIFFYYILLGSLFQL